jgi:hypothetical protein
MKRKIGLVLLLLTLFWVHSYAFASYSTNFEGKPKLFNPGNSLGYFMWQDKDGFHLRTTSSGMEHVFSGTIHTNGRFENIFGKTSETNDYSRVNEEWDKITFKFTNSGRESGIDLSLKGGTYITFDLFMDDNPMNPENIFIGSDGWHPGSFKFTLQHDGSKNRDNTIFIINDDLWWGWGPPHGYLGHGPGGPREARW